MESHLEPGMDTLLSLSWIPVQRLLARNRHMNVVGEESLIDQEVVGEEGSLPRRRPMWNQRLCPVNATRTHVDRPHPTMVALGHGQTTRDFIIPK